MNSTRKVVVLGANSFSGQDFVDLLLDDPKYQVIGISRSPERSAVFLRYRIRSDLGRYRYHALDLNHDAEDLLQLLDVERPEYIVNFAAQSEVAPSWDWPEHWFQTNTVALARLVNHLRKQDYLKRYIHISSPEVYGNCHGTVFEDAPLNPSTPYAASKAAADMLLDVYQKQYGFPVLKVRATNVYGARQQLFKIIPRTVIYIRLGKRIPLHGGGRSVKSYIHVRDVSRGEAAVMEHGQVGSLYHLSPVGGVAVRTVVKSIVEILGKSFEDAVDSVEERPGQDAAYVIDSTRARTELGWSPKMELTTGIEETVRWIEDYWQQIAEMPLEYLHKS
ncbi:MAG: GDP-mannose 4,6-dehydratase [Verrucomicrobia bacterium]|nr:GDP-mannose 4,6-dehydratase [Verrucomicrobiota bacterium]